MGRRREGSGRPVAMAEVMSELLVRRGYARLQSSSYLSDAWNGAVEESLAVCSRPARLRGTTLEVVVSDSTLVQELTLRKADLMARLNGQLGEESVREIRFRVGLIEPD